jgi:hypothetical protein
MSYARIAETVGRSKTHVQRELKRPATEAVPGADGSGADYDPPGGGRLPACDPILADSRRQLEQERLELAKIDIQARRLEAQRRLELLQSGGAGNNGNGALLLFLEELRQMRAEMNRALAQNRQPVTTGPPAPSFSQQLGEYTKVLESLKQFSPPQPAPADPELRVALGRLDIEERDRIRRFELEAEERRAKAEGERIRNESIAKAIEASAPLIAGAVQTWFGNRESAPTTPENGAKVVPMPLLGPDGVPVDMVRGLCPRCRSPLGLRPEPGKTENCPTCALPIVVVGGKIVPKVGPDGGARNGGVPTFAS